MEMLPLVEIVPEMNLNLDPETGLIGAGGGDLIILSMDEINEEIAKVEAAADELMNSLDPNSAPLGSFPGREGNYVIAGKLTNMVYGFLIGMFIIIAAIPLLTSWGIL
ncbi:MAG: tetrahydromethanopterin S-methyltransferase subunit B [Methanobacteriaceae archaeon]|nr:tetrahydromethanopterin S-methyltransferase subunit B [Methanobacteriaceae archaeon]